MKNPMTGSKPKKVRFPLLARLISLARHRAPLKQYYLEIGIHFLKKGTKYQIGEVVSKRNMGKDRFGVTAISGMIYDFASNRINHTTKKMVVNSHEIEKGR